MVFSIHHTAYRQETKVSFCFVTVTLWRRYAATMQVVGLHYAMDENMRTTKLGAARETRRENVKSSLCRSAAKSVGGKSIPTKNHTSAEDLVNKRAVKRMAPANLNIGMGVMAWSRFLARCSLEAARCHLIAKVMNEMRYDQRSTLLVLIGSKDRKCRCKFQPC